MQVRANASKPKAMSYARLSEKEKILAEEVSALMAEAQRIDDAEDAQFGKDRRGDELPAELAHRKTRLAKLREAKKALEDQAREAAAEHAAEFARREGSEEDAIAERAAQARRDGGPEAQGAKELHRSGQQDHEDLGRVVRPVLQRPGRRRPRRDNQVIVAADLHDCAGEGGACTR